MNAATPHPLACDYLTRLKKAAAVLPRSRRGELLAEIESHLSEALPAGASETEALNVLERLGEPAEIVAEAGSGQASAPRVGLNERLAVTLLLVGGFIFVVGWFVGVVMLWSSRAWTLRDKLIGTLVIPGGLATTVFLFMWAGASTGGSSGVCVVPVTRVGSHGPKVANAVEKCVSSGGGVNYLALVLLGGGLVVLPILTSIYLSRRASRHGIATS
jgi:hypothetical protein